MLLLDTNDDENTTTEALLSSITNQMRKNLKNGCDNFENSKKGEAIMSPDPNEEMFYLINNTF